MKEAMAMYFKEYVVETHNPLKLSVSKLKTYDFGMLFLIIFKTILNPYYRATLQHTVKMTDGSEARLL